MQKTKQVYWSKIASADKEQFSNLVVGLATCPCCLQGNIKLVNDNGPKGSEESYYFENHHPKGDVGGNLCPGSEQSLKELNAWLRGEASNMNHVAGTYAEFKKAQISTAAATQPA
ncbi:MAG TPA: hypothetical protein VF803_00755 [Candidatus Paceibacterota bacterium]